VDFLHYKRGLKRTNISSQVQEVVPTTTTTPHFPFCSMRGLNREAEPKTP